MKKALVIYDSRFGNTETLAEALADGIRKGGVRADCVGVGEVDVGRLSEYDFIAVGGPTHKAGMSEPMKDFLEGLKQADIRGKKGFCFDTRIHSRLNRFDLNGAAKRIEGRMRRMKVRMIEPRRSAIVEGREGPLENGSLEEFERLGMEMAEAI